MKIQAERAVAAMEDLGFTPLESRVYVELLRSGPQSGYRIAQLVGKAAANTYKALESLAARGAATYDDAGTRIYRGVPYAQLRAMLASDFSRRAERADALLTTLEQTHADEGVYRITHQEQAFEHARKLIRDAMEVVLVDAFPKALAQLQCEIEAALTRGVRVGVRAYDDSACIPGAVIAEVPAGASILEAWPGVWMNVVADGSSLISAFLSADGDITSGMATENRYFAWVYHSGLYHEILMAHLMSFAQAQPKLLLSRAVENIFDLLPGDAPGRRRITQKGSHG